MDEKVVPEKYRSEHVSREENKDAPILNAGAVKLFRGTASFAPLHRNFSLLIRPDNYAADPLSPLMSPVAFPTGHQGLPPHYFQICGLDPLRDDGIIYDRILREECGIDTRVDLYPGLPHGFWSWWPTADFTRKQQQDSIEGLGWLLKGEQ